MQVEPLHDRRRQAISRAVAYLVGEQQRGYPEATHVLTFPRPSFGGIVFETHRTVLFQRLIVLDSLLDAAARGEAVPAELFEAEAQQIIGARHPYVRGGWSYIPELRIFPPDADDLAAVLHVARRLDNAELAEMCHEALRLTFRCAARPDGSVATWIVDQHDPGPATRNILRCIDVIGGRGVHSDVVANLLEGLTCFAPDRYAAQIAHGGSYLVSVQSPDGSWPSKWYWGTLYGTFRALRVLRFLGNAPGPEKSAHAHVLATQLPDGGWGQTRPEPLSTALAVLCLQQNGRARQAAQAGLAWLVERQSEDGSWEACPFIKMETQNGILSYQSRTATTAFCLKALLEHG